MWSLLLTVGLQLIEWWFAKNKADAAGYEAFLKFVQTQDKERAAKLRKSYKSQVQRIKEELAEAEAEKWAKEEQAKIDAQPKDGQG